MTWFQYGDGRVVIGGTTHTVRLTMSGLAELDARFGISGAKALADRLRALTPKDSRALLDILLIGSSAAELSDDKVGAQLPEMCRVIETAFGEIHV